MHQSMLSPRVGGPGMPRAFDCISHGWGRAVIKRRGPGISPGYYERLPRLLSKENKIKIEPKEIPSCLIPRLLVVFTRQLEILVTTLVGNNKKIAVRQDPEGGGV